MVVLITVVQEGMFGGVAFGSSSTPVLAAAGILSCAAAFAGGFAAAWVAGRAYRTHALVMSGLIVIETTVLLATGQLDGPVWFDVSAAASLIAGIVAGAEVFRLARARLLHRPMGGAGAT